MLKCEQTKTHEREFLTCLSPSTVWQSKHEIWNHPNRGLKPSVAMGCATLGKWPKPYGASGSSSVKWDYNTYFSRSNKIKHTKSYIQWIFILSSPSFICYLRILNMRREELWLRMAVPSAEGSPTGNEGRVQWRECQGRTQEGERTVSGMEDYTTQRWGHTEWALSVPIRPICKGTGVFGNHEIT